MNRTILFMSVFLVILVSAVIARPAEPQIVKETVKCVFLASADVQKCYTDNGNFGCSGAGTCIAEISGEEESTLLWKSSCDGQGKTVMDGLDEFAEFKCESKPKTNEPSTVQEQVTCIFKNSKTQQQCYTEEFSCKSQDTCIVDIQGKAGEKVTWKSSCGGYGYSVLDTVNEEVMFTCIPEEKVTSEAISGKGFSSAAWQCYDGAGKQGVKSCQTSEAWQDQARSFCEGHCSGSKCGVNSFSVIGECYPDFAGTVFVSPVAEPAMAIAGISPLMVAPATPAKGAFPTKVPEKKTESEKENILICKDSCALNEKCYPFGYRKASQFCSDQGTFTAQTAEETTCDNNFECASNVCVNSKCVSVGLMEKILNWFKRLWG